MALGPDGVHSCSYNAPLVAEDRVFRFGAIILLGACVERAGPTSESPRPTTPSITSTSTTTFSNPDPFPEHILFRTATDSFNSRWYVVVREGRIWVRPNAMEGAVPGDWELLGSGLPEGGGLVRFDPPQSIVEISADGVHLTALSSAGVFYRGTDMTRDIHASFEWTDRWGWPAAAGSGLTAEFSTDHGWDVADSHPLGVAHYEDINDQEHSVGLGVAHLYRLGPDGHRIYFNDWWLPEDWTRQICGPQRGTFVAETLSASASTMLLLGAGGELYTRLYDFDTGGENSLYTYSYVVQGWAGTTRALPAEPWRRQPEIDGEITGRIAVAQTGQGNAARVLRVEGVSEGTNGFFHKDIYDAEWQFYATDLPLGAPLLDTSSPAASVPSSDSARSAVLTREADPGQLELELLDFNPFCSPARVQISVDGEVVTAGGLPLELELHHVHTGVSELRAFGYWDQGLPAFVQAALIVSDAIDDIDDVTARSEVVRFFDGQEVINLLGEVSATSFDLDEIPRGDPFRVPWNEKGVAGALFHLDD